MLHFQLGSKINFTEDDMERLYDRFSGNNAICHMTRTNDLLVSTFALLFICLALFLGLTILIDGLIIGPIDGTMLSGSEFIFKLHLLGGVLLGLKVLYDSIVYTYLIHSIMIKLEKDEELKRIYEYLSNEWEITINV